MRNSLAVAAIAGTLPKPVIDRLIVTAPLIPYSDDLLWKALTAFECFAVVRQQYREKFRLNGYHKMTT